MHSRSLLFFLLAAMSLTTGPFSPEVARAGSPDPEIIAFDRSPVSEVAGIGRERISFLHTPTDVGRDFRGLFTNNNLVPIMIGFGLTGLARTLDEHEIGGSNPSPREGGEESSLGRIGEKMGDRVILPGVIASLAVTSRIANNPPFERFSYSLVQGYIVNSLLTSAVKEAVGRERPNRRNNRSFPSGHTSNAFTWATILSHYYGRKAAIPAYGVAGFIGWSRLNMDAHYLSDVIFGAVLGYVVGRTIVRTAEKRSPSNRFQWQPTGGPREIGVEASYTW